VVQDRGRNTTSYQYEIAQCNYVHIRHAHLTEHDVYVRSPVVLLTVRRLRV